MALYTLVDPVAIEEMQANYMDHSDGKTKILQKIKMTEKEKDGIFFGLCIIIGIQLFTVILIANEFVLNIELVKVDNFWILVPRIISSFYMHSTLAAEITNGLDTMKYVVNHPSHFLRKALDQDDSDRTDSDDGWYIRYTYAFMLGFIQYILTVILEVMTIIFLNSLGSYLFILLCYAALSGVTTFDDMYANALSGDHSIKKVVGQTFYTNYHRYMKFSNQRDVVDGSQNIQDKIEGEDKLNLACQSQILLPNPRTGSCYFKFFRFIYKFWRIFHVSFFFYFAPFLMLVYQFYLNNN